MSAGTFKRASRRLGSCASRINVIDQQDLPARYFLRRRESVNAWPPVAKFSGASSQQFFAPRRQAHHVSVNDVRERMRWWPLARGNHTHQVVAAQKPVQRIAVLSHEPCEEHAQQIRILGVMLLVTWFVERQPIAQRRWFAVEADRQDLRARSAYRVFVLTAVAAQIVTQRTPTTTDGTYIGSVTRRLHELNRQLGRAGD